MSEPAQGAEPPSMLQPQNLQRTFKQSRMVFTRSYWHLQSGWDDHELLFVIGRGDSFKGLEPLEGILSALSLVGGHATHLHQTVSG